MHAHHKHLLRVAASVFAYNAVLFLVFTALYLVIGFEKNFKVMMNPANQTQNTGVSAALYFSSMTHGLVGCADITPATPLARSLVSLHVVLVFLQVSSVIIFASTIPHHP